MDIRTKILVSKFKNNSFFTDLEDYIKERVSENKLSYDNVKYLYNNLYKGYSEFIKQNIYPVGEFLADGHSIEECEKLADLLDDATGKSVFCYEKKENGYKYNKLFLDLKFCYDTYHSFIKYGESKDEAFKKTKYELSTTPLQLREIIVNVNSDKYLYFSELEHYSRYLLDEIGKIRNGFEKIIEQDENLEEHFEDDFDKRRCRNIVSASSIVRGIDLRNFQRERGFLKGEKEEYPYNKEELKLINLYRKFADTFEQEQQIEEKQREELEM